MRAINYVLAAAFASPALSWGIAGHEIVATIAQIHLHPSVFPVICDVLNYTSPIPGEPQCHLAPIAGWADRMRYKMRWSSSLHYVNGLDDYPSQTCAFPGPRGWAGPKGHNVLGGLRNVSTILENYVDGTSKGSHPSFASEEAANEALKFLVHFFGDLHMPLHLVGRDRGGNSVKVRFGGRLTNLHSTWDGLLIAKAIRETAPKYSHPLPSPQIEWALRGTIYDSYVRQIMWEGILDKWADEVDSWLACPADPQPETRWQQVISTVQKWTTGVTDPGRETDDSVLCPYHWASAIHGLNCELIWPKELDEPPYKHNAPSRLYSSTSEHDHAGCHHDEAEDSSEEEDMQPPVDYLQLDTPEYAGVIRKRQIIEKLLAQAGIRLAAHLNWLFATPDEVGMGLLYRRHSAGISA